MSPTRPRQHQIESESARVFERLMPSAWVVRNQPSDYGIDQEVEVFEDDRATSLLFKVQLKGSDRVKPERPSVVVSTETFRYWLGLDVPLLLVLVDVQAKVAYARWAFAIDELRGVGEPGETFTVHFAEADALDEQSHSVLAEDVARLRMLRRRDIPRPLPVRVCEEEGWIGPSSHAVRARIAAQRILSGVVDPRTEEGTGYVVDLRRDLVVVRLPMNYGSVSFNPGSTCDAEGLAATVALALGLSLGRAGIDAVALPVIEKALRHAPELAADDILTASLELFLGRASAAQCLELGLWLLELTGPVPWLCAQPLVVHGIRVLPADPAGTARRLTAAYHECAARLREEGDRETAGRAHFNLAAALRHLGCLSEAVIEFAAAQELRPEYSNEPRFRRMLGGALWDLGDYCDAADEYEAGIRCSTTGDEDLVPLWADALFAAGEFGQSSDAMRDWVPGPGHVELGVIVGCISDLVVNVVGLRSQHRNPLAPGELDEALIAVLADGAMPPREQAWPALLTLLREQDAADPRLWTLASEVLEQPTRASGLLLVAHVVHSSAMIWTEAVRDLDEAGLTEVRDAAIVSALRRCGAEFLESSEGGAEPLDPVLISRVHELSVLLVDELPTATDDGFYEIDPPPLTLPGAD